MQDICQIKELYKFLYQYEREFCDQNNITINEAMLLCCLKDSVPKPAGELAEFIGLSGSRVSRIISAVEEQGLIVRDFGQKDKRSMIFNITDKGVEKLEQLREKVCLDGFMNKIKSLLQ